MQVSHSKPAKPDPPRQESPAKMPTTKNEQTSELPAVATQLPPIAEIQVLSGHKVDMETAAAAVVMQSMASGEYLQKEYQVPGASYQQLEQLECISQPVEWGRSQTSEGTLPSQSTSQGVLQTDSHGGVLQTERKSEGVLHTQNTDTGILQTMLELGNLSNVYSQPLGGSEHVISSGAMSSATLSSTSSSVGVIPQPVATSEHIISSGTMSDTASASVVVVKPVPQPLVQSDQIISSLSSSSSGISQIPQLQHASSSPSVVVARIPQLQHHHQLQQHQQQQPMPAGSGSNIIVTAAPMPHCDQPVYEIQAVPSKTTDTVQNIYNVQNTIVSAPVNVQNPNILLQGPRSGCDRLLEGQCNEGILAGAAREAGLLSGGELKEEIIREEIVTSEVTGVDLSMQESFSSAVSNPDAIQNQANPNVVTVPLRLYPQ